VVVAGYLLVPTAPPRMLRGGPEPASWAHSLQSQYAALPSGHVAFAVVVAGVVGLQVRALRRVAPLYPLLVSAVVIATGNHLWIDAVAGVAAAGAGLVMARTWRMLRENRVAVGRRTQGDVSSEPSPTRGGARSPARA
jgi:hypothetical protein